MVYFYCENRENESIVKAQNAVQSGRANLGRYNGGSEKLVQSGKQSSTWLVAVHRSGQHDTIRGIIYTPDAASAFYDYVITMLHVRGIPKIFR